MSSGDHDADAIRNQRLHKLLPKLERLVNALDGGGAPAAGDEAKAKEAFDLGNRVEDALKHLDEKMRAIGDLPDVLRAKCDEVDKLVAAGQDGLKNSLFAETSYKESKAEVDALVAELKAAQAKPEAEAPKPASEGGQDGPANPTKPETIAAENAETAQDAAERTGSKA